MFRDSALLANPAATGHLANFPRTLSQMPFVALHPADFANFAAFGGDAIGTTVFINFMMRCPPISMTVIIVYGSAYLYLNRMLIHAAAY